MKLRQHLRMLQEKIGQVPNLSEESSTEDNREDLQQETTIEESSTTQEDQPSTEEDLVGVTQVAYIQPNNEPEEDAESITLPPETELINKEACTLSAIPKKEIVDMDANDSSSVFMVDDADQEMIEADNTMDEPDYNAIANAVKATLASQPGINVQGELQMKVNQQIGRMTQVEVTTEDGSVIVIELMTEEDNDTTEADPEQEVSFKLHLITKVTTCILQVNEEGELKIFQCPDCSKSFARRIQLRRHASVHMQQRGFSCGICEKWFPTRSALVRHERIHTGERPFQCEVCQKSFAQKEILFRHLMTHTGQKPYNCPHCPKGFTQKEPLRVHLRSHMNPNPQDIQLHYCTLCPKVFCHASGLSRHLVTHTGKTFKCSDCDKSFTDKSSLRRHYRQTLHQLNKLVH